MRKLLTLFGNTAETKELLKSINSAEFYLKARYRTHCSNEATCSSHCINYALSHPTDKDLFSKCDIVHDHICEECQNIIDCIRNLKVKAAGIELRHEREVSEYEICNAEMKIMDLQKHIIRGVQQSKARSDALANLDQTSALWLRDYAQKVNPCKVKHFFLILFLLRVNEFNMGY